MTGYVSEPHSPLPFIPFGELLIDPPAPNSCDANYTEYKDIKSLVNRDPNVAATITSVSLGMVLAGVVNDGKPKARDILVAVKQIDNDIRSQQEEIQREKKKSDQSQKAKKDMAMAKEAKEEQENGKSPFDDFFDGGKSPLANLFELLTEETPEKCELVTLPQFAWEEISEGNLVTGISPPNVMLCRFKKSQMALAA